MLSRAREKRGLILFLLCAAELLVGVDFAIVNVALPSIQEGLGFSPEGLQWVITGLLLPFGGLLLIAGRAADLFGRKRILVWGLGLFSVASLVAGFALAPWMLVAGRAAQGVASAMIAPAALSLITTIFREGPERDRALGVAGAVLPLGFVVGMILGGVLTEVSWRLTMFINVPVGLLVLALTVLLLPESRDRLEAEGEAGARGLDVPGALSGTAALLALIYGISLAESAGWASAQTFISLASAAALGAAFVTIEGRAAAPLAPLWVLGKRSVWGSNLPGMVTFAAAVGVIFTITLYMQQVLAYTPLQTGLAFAFMGLTSILGGKVAPPLIARFGASFMLVGGLLTQAVGTALLILLSANPRSLAILLLGLGITGFGHIVSIVAFRSIAASGLPDREQGLSAGIANVSQHVGAALGVAIFAAVAVARSDALRQAGATAEEALVGGGHYAVGAGTILLGLAALFAVFALHRTGTAKPTAEPDTDQATRAASKAAAETPAEAASSASDQRCANDG